MTTRVGRTLPSTPVRPSGITTASGYNALDALGSAFRIPYAAGAGGGVITQVIVFDRGSAINALRMHCYSTAFSASPDGGLFEVAASDYASGLYLGYVDIASGTWITGGSAQMMSRVVDQNIGIYSLNEAREIHCQMQYVGGNSAYAVLNPLTVMTVAMQD